MKKYCPLSNLQVVIMSLLKFVVRPKIQSKILLVSGLHVHKKLQFLDAQPNFEPHVHCFGSNVLYELLKDFSIEANNFRIICPFLSDLFNLLELREQFERNEKLTDDMQIMLHPSFPL